MWPKIADSLYRLYDSSKKVIFMELTYLQLREVVSNLKSQEFSLWYVSQLEEAQWHPLSDKISEILDVTEGDSMKVVNLTTPVTAVTAAKNSSEAPSIRLQANTKEKRKTTRTKKKIEVYIDVGNQILTAHTQDLSVLAIKLEEKFPTSYRATYSLILRVKPTIELRCTPLIADADFRRGLWDKVKVLPNHNLEAYIAFLSKQ